MAGVGALISEILFPLSCGRCTASPRRRRGDVADITPGSPDSHRRLLVAAADPFCTVDFLNEAY